METLKNLSNIVLLSLLFLSIGCGPVSGGTERKDKTAHVLVFEDTDRDGEHDPGEATLPDVLVAGSSNIHGEFTMTAQLTNSDGETDINATYTHFFDVAALTPCGYEATTPTELEAERQIEFGFAPLDPQSGIADLYLLLWHDANQDGEYQTGEMPLAGETLLLNPGLPWGESYDIFTGELSVSTSSGGEAAATLGNSCGEVVVLIPYGWKPSTDATGEGVWEEGRYRIAYRPGRTTIYLGVVPVE